MSDQAQDTHFKVAIFGSGPAGYTAAIYAARAGLKPVVFAGPTPGGQLTTTSEVENYPGYPQGTNGMDMMEDLRIQAERFGSSVRYTKVVKVDFTQSPKRFWIEEGDEFTADAVIIATGAEAKFLGLPKEQELRWGGGVTACAVCDGFFYRGVPVAVVGGGDTAAEEAIYLSGLCSEVHLLVRSDKMRASQIMQQRVLNNPKIKVHWNTETVEILAAEKVVGIRVRNRITSEESTLEIKGFFLAIGHEPQTAMFKGILDMNEIGYILTEGKSTRTNIEGVFAAGDAQDFTYRQAITAAGTGCMAALDAERWLSEHGLS
jgi:thioredoxin reductase (NADPH)